ncbi:MAG: pseudouridine synthase [Bryobacteraceae bacterium]
MAPASRKKLQRLPKTLERVLSRAGLGSRTDARSWISAGRIGVNGRVAHNPGQWVDLGRDLVSVDDKPLQAAEPVCILLHKPKGYLTTYRDPEGRPTVYDLVAGVGAWVSPVGRLDLDTSGLLLMTNDTGLAERISNPERKIPKTYLVGTATILSEEQLDRLRRGVELKDGPAKPAEVRRVRDGARHTELEMTITEGRNRQVRRMMEAVDGKVLKLVRTAIGPLRIDGLALGEWRKLTKEELSAFRR